MNPFEKLAKALQSIDLEKIVSQSIAVQRLSLLEANKKQLQQGLDSEGNPIVPRYTAYTRRIKAAKGQPFDRVTLKDSGAFYEKFNIEKKGSTFQFTSSDEKKDKLVLKYGKNIFGVQKNNEVFNEIRDTIIAKIKSRLTS